jgi:DNA polymerase II large subunit
VYECPTCETRALAEQRCAECNTFTRRIGLGGNCQECDAVILLTDLLDGIVDLQLPSDHRLDRAVQIQ